MLLIKLITLYQNTLSLWIGPVCRYYPTCSHYTQEALREWGLMKGLWLGLKRILKCNPWGGCGFDFVPKKKKIDAKKDRSRPI